jgi:probable F420-dependent oxidoreductase
MQMAVPFPGMTWLDSARMVEDLGYSSLLMPDHFTEQYGPLTSLAAAASVTSTLKVGALVFGNDYRHPVVMAKEMATLDHISEGRVEFGLGAGWMRTDYDQSGQTYDRPGIRIERFEESLEVIRRCWAGEPFDFDGVHYQMAGYDGLPKPYTEGGPPVMIGAGGPRMIGVAARNATIVGLTANLRAGEVGPDAVADSMPEAFDAKVARLHEVAGDKDIEISSLTMATVVTDDREGTLAGMAELFGAPPELVEASPLLIAGSVDQIVESLQERRERWGFSYIVVQPTDNPQQFAEVIAKLAGT